MEADAEIRQDLVVDLKKEIDRLKKENDSLKKENDRLTQETFDNNLGTPEPTELERDLETAKKELREAHTRIGELTMENARLQETQIKTTTA